MTSYLNLVLSAIAEHPNWVGLFVFLTAMSEAVALIGSVIPGTTILIAVGAAVGLGHLPLWPILIYATLGAIAGDGVSYWLGHRYKHRLNAVWPFSRRPELLASGEAFFARHGAKSVALGRFVPVLRAIIPLVAGTMGMSPARFYVANVLSALIWAPAHILPGALLGLSLGVVGAMSGRLVVALLVVAAFVTAAVWILRLSLLRIVPVLGRLQRSAVEKMRRVDHWAPRLAVAILDPDHPDARKILVLGATFLTSIIGFLAIVEDVLARETIVRMDASVSNFVQGLRTAWGDNVMVVVTTFGDGVVTAAVALASIAWLASRRAWQLAFGLAGALVLAALFVPLLKSAFGLPRPIDLYAGADAFSFPSGHATLAATLYGCLAWLVGSGLTGGRRIFVFAVSASIVATIAASRIYLAAHWPSDVAAGLLVGFALASVYGLAFPRIDGAAVRPVDLSAVAAVALLFVGSWHAWTQYDRASSMYAEAPREVQRMSALAWRTQGWQHLPTRRIDLRGETDEALVLQWAGPLVQLERSLTAAGWQREPTATIADLMGYLSGSTPLQALPVLPALHNGHAPALTMVRSGPLPDRRIVLRVWSTDVAVTSASGTTTPVYVGSLITQQLRRWWGIVSTVGSKASSGDAVEALRSSLAATRSVFLQRKGGGEHPLLLGSPIGAADEP